jgi:hypothetical protein
MADEVRTEGRKKMELSREGDERKEGRKEGRYR